MNELWFCPSCGKKIETKIVAKEETLMVKGKELTLKVNVRVCKDCGEEITDEELDGESLKLFYDEYKKSENLLTSREIAEIRNKFGLSQSALSRLLGFGEKTITRYENGSIQDLCHDNLLRLMRNYDSFIEIWETRKNYLTNSENANISKRIHTYQVLMDTSYSSNPVYFYSNPIVIYKNGGEHRNAI